MPPNHVNGSRLEALERLAIEAGAENLAKEVLTLSTRIREGLFYVACVGQFKRGKSSLLNALVGEVLLPVGVVPVTAVVTVLRHGQRRAARLRMEGSGWRNIDPDELTDYVAEERNPENKKGVDAVEVFTPSPLLASGMCLVDTPGIGSVFTGNTEATRAFVPHVDAALVVLGADPPISADELDLVEEIANHCPNLLFVLSKADKLADQERQEATEFTRRVLSQRLGMGEVCIHEVSAKERLSGNGPSRGWPELTSALTRLARQSGSELVRAAEERGLVHLGGKLKRHLEEERGALVRPLEETERRVEALRLCVADAERSLNDLGYLFAAEQDRLARIFSDKRGEFLKHALASAREELARSCRELPARRGPALRKASIRLALEIATRWLDRWLAEAEPTAEALYVQAMERFRELADGFLQEIKQTGESALSGLPDSINPEVGFRWRSRLFYKDLWQYTGAGPAIWLLDAMRSRNSILASIDLRLGDYIQQLLETNATRIENDFNERVMESRRRYQYEIRTSIQEALAVATRSLERARELKAQGIRAIQEEIDRIDEMSDRLGALAPHR
ncbi:MAG: dynamin family protein [Bradymonadales bacterium]|nr:dynamin family protein [Bradymonadales bacterium]